MFGLIGKLIGAAALGAVGYVGYKRFFGSTDAMACDVETPWYLPTPKYSCGESRKVGEIVGMQYQAGEWVYNIKTSSQGNDESLNAIAVKESAMESAAPLLKGAAVRIL